MALTSFLQMSEAVSELIRGDIGLIERLGERRDVASLFDLEGMWARDVRAKHGADMLMGLIPHEREARDLARDHGVINFPLFSADVIGIAPGDRVLIRAMLTELEGDACRLEMVSLGGRLTTGAWVARGDIIGIERPARMALAIPLTAR